jgi:hypothetical protein
MHDWQVNTWRTCAQPVAIRAMPENEIPPAMRVDYYLFALNVNAHRMSKEEVIGKFKTLTNGSKENATIGQMASTFLNLCAYADWTETPKKGVVEMPIQEIITDTSETKKVELGEATSNTRHSIDLNYDIHIHLPATRDQAVYDALFASLAKHIPLK